MRRILTAVRTEWWRIFPHRFYTLRGSPHCGRCGVPVGIHGHFEE